MANPYHDFTAAPVASHGYDSLNQGMGGLTSVIAQQYQQQKAQEDAIKLLVLKSHIDQQDALAQERSKQQAIFDMQGQQMNRAKRMYPEMFGGQGQSQQPQTQSPMEFNPLRNMQNVVSSSVGGNVSRGTNPIDISAIKTTSSPMGGQFNPVKSGTPSPLTIKVDPMTGKMSQIVNPEYSLYRSQELAKMRNKMQPESADAASAITYRDSLTKSIKEIKGIVNKPGFDWGLFGASRVSNDNPSATTFRPIDFLSGNKDSKHSQDLLKIHNALQFIKKSAFGEAGKQLTDIEKQLVYSVLQPSGQPKEEWIKNLDKSLGILSERAKLLARNKDNLDTTIASTETDGNLDKQVNDMLDKLGVE